MQQAVLGGKDVNSLSYLLLKNPEMFLLQPKQAAPHVLGLLFLLPLLGQVVFVTVLLGRGTEQGEIKLGYSCLLVEI